MRIFLWILGLVIIISGFWVWRAMAATIGAGAAWPWLLLTILAAVVVIGMATHPTDDARTRSSANRKRTQGRGN